MQGSGVELCEVSKTHRILSVARGDCVAQWRAADSIGRRGFEYRLNPHSLPRFIGVLRFTHIIRSITARRMSTA